jgi:ribosomal protein S27AE
MATSTVDHRVCPGCNGAFYATTGAQSLSCPRCGYVVLDGRPAKRIKTEIPLTFYSGGRSTPVRLVDYSEGGLRIAYKGKALEVNSLIALDIEKLNIHGTAMAVWTRKISGAISTGFRII